MKELSCEQVRDLLPGLLAGSAGAVTDSAVREHVRGCASCAAELAIARSVAALRPEVPIGLEARVRAAAGNRRVAYWIRGRMAAVASVAVAIIGGSVVVAPYLKLARPVGDEPAPVQAIPAAGFFSVDQAFASGTASLGDLTETELQQLLVELEP